ncbi:MAG TPA: cation diffusion facilitator family transporter, partial [Candidatus Baltobacteraceae bacterium]|nr:cation diffusion facilitator family transporter [Candidatus Baltobacteraceae bacterium]
MGHDHSHHEHGNEPGRLGIALGLSLALLGIELFGAHLSGSLSLLADAAHMATDAVAAGLALFTAKLAQRPRTAKRTFGYGRSTVIAALVNASTLIAIALSLSVEALHRFAAPPPVQPTPMLIVASLAVVGNGGILWLLMRGGGVSLNVRAVLMHLAT